MGNPCRNVEVIAKKFWKERNCLHTGNFISVAVGAVYEVFFVYERKRVENGQNLSLWLGFFCLSLSSLCLSLSSLSLSLSLSLSFPFFVIYIFFVEEREREEVWIQLMMQIFWRVVQCVCGGRGGSRCLCVRKFPVFLVFCHVDRERNNVKLIFVFDFKKEKLSEFGRLGTVPSYNLFFFFFFRVYC